MYINVISEDAVIRNLVTFLGTVNNIYNLQMCTKGHDVFDLAENFLVTVPMLSSSTTRRILCPFQASQAWLC